LALTLRPELPLLWSQCLFLRTETDDEGQQVHGRADYRDFERALGRALLEQIDLKLARPFRGFDG